MTLTFLFERNYTEMPNFAFYEQETIKTDTKRMKYIYSFLLLVTLILNSSVVKAQKSISDSTIGVGLIGAGGGFYLPFGDIADRYGVCYSIGPNIWYKTDKNWIWGADFNYHFSGNIDNENQILANLKNSVGAIIDEGGQPALISILMRGYSFYGKVGKVIPLKFNNPNSGIMIQLGVGYFRHKYAIGNIDNTAPQIKDDYRKGYDRLRAGISFTQLIGYMNLSDSRLTNFYGGIEIHESITNPLRDYDFSLMKKETGTNIDILVGFRIGWLFPLYGTATKAYYYY